VFAVDAPHRPRVLFCESRFAREVQIDRRSLMPYPFLSPPPSLLFCQLTTHSPSPSATQYWASECAEPVSQQLPVLRACTHLHQPQAPPSAFGSLYPNHLRPIWPPPPCTIPAPPRWKSPPTPPRPEHALPHGVRSRGGRRVGGEFIRVD